MGLDEALRTERRHVVTESPYYIQHDFVTVFDTWSFAGYMLDVFAKLKWLGIAWDPCHGRMLVYPGFGATANAKDHDHG